MKHMKTSALLPIAAAALACALALASPAPALADHMAGDDGWTVTYTASGTIESSYSGTEVQDSVGTLQPGDDITLTITLANASASDVDWYMWNTILKSLEDGTSAAGGAYTYVLTYRTSSGETKDLYDSDRVGGDSAPEGTPEGLHGVDDALKDYFFLETMPAGTSGVVTLVVALDGESQGNGYQKALADLQMRFAAEAAGSGVVATGDERELRSYYIAMIAAGAVFLALAVFGLAARRRKGGDR